MGQADRRRPRLQIYRSSGVFGRRALRRRKEGAACMRDIDPKIVSAVYDGIVESDALAPALVALARQFECGSASIVSFDPLEPRASLSAIAGSFPEDARRRYNEDFE